MVEVPLFASLRSVLGYTALVSAAAVFLPGHSQLTAGLAILVIALGWETLRPIARVIASSVVCVLLLAGIYNGQVLSNAFDGMQPKFKQTPPRECSRSTKATRKPRSAALKAAA